MCYRGELVWSRSPFTYSFSSLLGSDANPPWSSNLGELNTTLPTARTGSYSLARDSAFGKFRAISPGTTTLIAGFACYRNNKLTAIRTEETSGGTVQWQVNCAADGSVVVNRGTSTSIAATAAGVHNANA